MSRPITFQNNKQPCLNAENLNKMQDELNPFRNSKIDLLPTEYNFDNNSMYLVIAHVNGSDLGIMDIVLKQGGTVYKTSLITYPSNVTVVYTNEKVTITPSYTTGVSIIKLM